MTNEEKIRDILNRHYGHEVMDGSDLWFTKQYQDRYAHLLEIVEWKDKQMIEKACEWLENNTITTTFKYTYTASSYNIDKKTFIEQFKEAMEDE